MNTLDMERDVYDNVIYYMHINWNFLYSLSTNIKRKNLQLKVKKWTDLECAYKSARVLI